MSADSLGEQFKLYHGSNQDFNVGDEVKPGDMVPRTVKSRESADPNRYGTSRWSDDFSEHGHQNFVWSTTDPEHTGMYGKNLYEVHPQGLTERYTYPTTGNKSKDTHVSLAPMKVVRRGKLAGPHPKNPSIQKIEWDE
jgi:hypothetical protein